MKLLFLAITIILFAFKLQAQSTGTLTDINSNTLNIDSLNSKKCLIIILPLQADTSVVNQILRFKSRFLDSVQVIGMVCTSTPVSTIHTLYDILIDAGVFITTGYTSNNSPSTRAAVIKWISDRNNNRAAESGIGLSKYFISPGGNLYAQPGATISVDAPVIYNLVKTKIPGEN